MKPYHIRKVALGTTLSCLTALTSFASDLTTSLPAGSLPPIKFDDGRGTIEIIDRTRWEDRENNFDFDSGAKATTDGNWWLNRLRVGANWKPDSATTFQFQLQDAREWGSNRPKVPYIQGAEGNEPLNLHLANFSLGDPKTSPVVVTIGRQVIALGEERLVGPGEWNNFARVFDAAKAVWTVKPGLTATFFASSVVVFEPTTSNEKWRLEQSHFDNDMFDGAYISDKLSPRDTFETYLFWRDKKSNDPIYSAPTAAIPAAARSTPGFDIAQDIYTYGARCLRAPKPGEFDAEIEADVQWGHVDRQTTAATGTYAGSTPHLDQQSWAWHSLLGYTLMGVPGGVRLDVEYNVASGDTNRNDSKNGSFMTLFPSGHKWYGFMDLTSWKNLREAVATMRFSPLPQFPVRIDYHSFSLYNSQDAWYRKNGVATVRPLNPAAQHAPTHTGDELDVTGTWTIRPWAALELGWCHFFAGSYLGATGARSDANFTYVQSTFKF